MLVSLTTDCARPPRGADLKFLGPPRAKVQQCGKLLDVHLDVEAGDVAEALPQARDVVLGGIDGDV